MNHIRYHLFFLLGQLLISKKIMVMKMNIIKTYLVAGFACAFCSCSDFLDKSDPTKLNSGNFYKTEEQFKQAVNGVLSQLQDYTSGVWQYKEFIQLAILIPKIEDKEQELKQWNIGKLMPRLWSK